MKSRLVAMGLVPTIDGEEWAREGWNDIYTSILHDLDRLDPNDLLTVSVITSGLVYDAQTAAAVKGPYIEVGEVDGVTVVFVRGEGLALAGDGQQERSV